MNYVIRDLEYSPKFDEYFEYLVKKFGDFKRRLNLFNIGGQAMTPHNLDYKTEISEETCRHMSTVRAAAMVLEDQISLSCKDSRETSLAYTKLEECLMWAIKSLAVHGHDVPLGEEQK